MRKSKPSIKTEKKSSKISTWIHGCTGKMGQALQGPILLKDSPMSLTGGSDSSFVTINIHQDRVPMSLPVFSKALTHAELFMDFSSPQGNHTLLQGLTKSKVQGVAVMVGTTGLTSAQIKAWQAFAVATDSRVLIAPNTSLGVIVLLQACKMAAPLLNQKHFDIEISESHHRNKGDAPSGTALFLAESIASMLGLKAVYGRKTKRANNEIGISSLRGGSIFGEHTVHFIGDLEQVSFSHRAFSRQLFAEGALHLGQWIVQQKPGFYGLDQVDLKTLSGV